MPAGFDKSRGAAEGDKTSGPMPAWVIRFGSAAAGAIGLSGLLYACGFVAARSHQTFWGLWGGPSEDAAGLVSEGGRFLYHLGFVLIDLLNPLASGASVGFYALLLAGIALWSVPVAPWRLWLARRTTAAHSLRVALPLVPALATVASGWVLLHDLASVLAPAALLHQDGAAAAGLRELLCRPGDAYFARASDWVALAVMFAITLWAQQLGGNVATRALAWLGGLFLLAATSLLPAAYGRLVLPPEYPQIEFTRDEGRPVPRVLIRTAGTSWVAWNLATRRTEVIALRQNESVVIGPRLRLGVATADPARGDACAKP